jgi:hypothetical protein
MSKIKSIELEIYLKTDFQFHMEGMQNMMETTPKGFFCAIFGLNTN